MSKINVRDKKNVNIYYSQKIHNHAEKSGKISITVPTWINFENIYDVANFPCE